MRVTEVIVTIDGKGRTFKAAKGSDNALRAIEEAREWLATEHKAMAARVAADQAAEASAEPLLDKPTKQRGKARAVRPAPVAIHSSAGTEG